MKILQCACILGAVAALYSVAQRATVREPSLAGAETLALAVLDNAHANLERDFAALPLPPPIRCRSLPWAQEFHGTVPPGTVLA